MPDLFNYFLTGVKRTEFTFATTSQLYNPSIDNWETTFFETLGIAKSIMQEIVAPSTVIGELTETHQKTTSLQPTPVVAGATHDTGAAVAAVPATDDDFVYISSGTWSLIGLENPRPIINEKTYQYNLTNEGGVCGNFRVLKNIMGLWLLQECKRQWEAEGEQYSYDELLNLATAATPFRTIVDPNYGRFLNPPDMRETIKEFAIKTGQPAPRNTGEFVRCILESLALSYRQTLDQLKEVSNKEFNRVHIIGGGSQNELLSQFAADATGLPVYTGPIEATAIGTILLQAMALNKIDKLTQLRAIVKKSFPLKAYEPRTNDNSWSIAYHKFTTLRAEKS